MRKVAPLRGARGELGRFLLVGTVGFLVDGAVLLSLVELGGHSRLSARVPSFLVAATVTWWLNRHFTFPQARRAAPTVREWVRFVSGNALGNGANLGLYWALVGIFNWATLAGLAVASLVAAGMNYAVSAHWVFRQRP